MVTTNDFPEIAFVRVVTSGGPYAKGVTLSVAFVTPGLARLAPHDDVIADTNRQIGSLVPEVISARVVRGAGPYHVGASLALSFVDPAIARIHQVDAVSAEAEPVRERATEGRSQAAAPPNRRGSEREIAEPAPIERLAPETVAAILRASDIRASQPDGAIATRAGVRGRLDWNRDRVRRFVQVVDKLFTIDRLGWYRHVFAMRLLVPDVVTCGNADADAEALRHLHALRAASIETLGRPLLAAFLPNFTVTPEWLDSLDKPGAARALSTLRESVLPYANDFAIGEREREDGWTITAIGRANLVAASVTSVEALLPVFIPHESPIGRLTEALGDYRTTLIDMFGQTAQSADAVRLTLMAEPNHTLDDRLSHVARAVNETFAGDAAA